MQLAVDVGQADVVEIHQGNSADTGPSQGLGCIAADPADAADHDMFVAEGFESSAADQQLGA